MKKIVFIFCAVTIFLIASAAIARFFRPNEIPNGTVNSCANCHVDPAGGGPRNAFGSEVESGFLDAPGSSGHVQWGPDLAALDSDGDGFTNGQELQDPFGLWSTGSSQPGNSSLVRLPGSASSMPPAEVAVPSLLVKFSSMGPHLGQLLEVRIWDKTSFVEVARTSIPAISTTSFNVTFMNILETGKSYWIDFYADHNGNGFYDVPPTDHAWRVSADNISGDTTIEAAHTTNFTDISFPVTGVEIASPDRIPREFILHQNYPNPFNPVTQIGFTVPEPSFVSMVVYNLLGQAVRVLENKRFAPGAYSVTFDGNDDYGRPLSSGIYYYRLNADGFSKVRKMLIKK